MRDITEVWERVKAHESEAFETKTHLLFTYTVTRNSLTTSRSRQVIGRTDFEKVLPMVPVKGPGEINMLVGGPAYLWAILHDPRIRGNDW